MNSLFPEQTSESAAKVTALVPWFGAKRNMADRIVAELGPHRAYWEPFCGSMAVLLAKPPATIETVSDLHGELVNLAWTMQHPVYGSVMYRRLRRVLMSQTEFFAARERILSRDGWNDDKPAVDRATDYFILSWQGMNGMAGTKSYNANFAKRYTKNGGHAATRWARAVDSIPAFRRRLRNVTILGGCGIELCERIEDAEGVVIYADPPYIAEGNQYLHSFDPKKHKRLATALGRFTRTRVVVSYYDHPDLSWLYPNWTKVDCTTTKAMVSSGRRDAQNDTKAPEVLLINGPSFTAGGEK